MARTQVPYLTHNSKVIRPGLKAGTAELVRRDDVPLARQLDELRQQLVNLPVFSRADWQITVTGTDTIVRWQFTESRTVFPLFNFGGIRGNTFYLVGVTDTHLRGRGQQLQAFYQNNGGEHNYFFALNNPSWNGSRWGYQLESRRYAAVEPLYFEEAPTNYRYANLSFSLGGSYALRPRQQIALGVSTFNERFRKLPGQEQTEGPLAANLQKILLKSSHTVDQRNFFGERVDGYYHQTIAQFVHTLDSSDPDFLIAWHNFLVYRRLGKRGNLAARLRAGLSSNFDSPFAPFVLDSQVNIRGSGNRIDRGTAQLVLNAEYRYTIYKDRRERFAVQLVAFSDLGTWRDPGGDFEDLFAPERLRHFVGGGLRLLSLRAHDAVLRIDYGLDRQDKQQRGFVVGFGQYF